LSCRQKESSSSEEKGENAKLAVPEKIGTPKLVEDKIPEAELILFLDAGLDDSQLKALSHRKRAASCQKRKNLRVEQGALILNAMSK
jgi:hypothetical protein